MVPVWGLRPSRVPQLRYKAGNSFYFSNCPVLSRLSQMQALIFTHLRFPPRGVTGGFLLPLHSCYAFKDMTVWQAGFRSGVILLRAR